MATSIWHNPEANGQRRDVEPLSAGSAPREPQFLAESAGNGASALSTDSAADGSGTAETAKPETPAGVTTASFDEPSTVGKPSAELPPAEQPKPEQPTAETPAPAEATPPADQSSAAEATGTEPAATEVASSEPAVADAAATEAAQSVDEDVDTAGLPAIAWHDDYHQAMEAAVEQQRNMFVLFCDPKWPAEQVAFEQRSLTDSANREKLLRDFVLVKLPTDAVIHSGGKPIRLLSHGAFAEMLGRPGVAIIDLAHPKADYYGHVVSTFPFMTGRYYKRPVLSTILNLPPGTLTQRTMIYAVRIHPEAPASTQGQFHGVLADEANRQSHYQAAVLVQGHQNWDSRVHRISSRVPRISDAKEVVAESWPSEPLVEACIDCVDSWRHSPGHWDAVRSRHPLFGFDIQRGRNGIWYATGIFGHR
ncbi:MAG TPA: hypothetical protein VMF30_14440 [Pirellulales bacterium]|nr:hypothetical protein [Pirellulales bacterium]